MSPQTVVSSCDAKTGKVIVCDRENGRLCEQGDPVGRDQAGEGD